MLSWEEVTLITINKIKFNLNLIINKTFFYIILNKFLLLSSTFVNVKLFKCIKFYTKRKENNLNIL